MDMMDGGGYNSNVRVRALLTAVLSLLLFSMSCWASACDLSCSLDALGTGCEGTSASQPNQQQTASMPADMQMDHGQMGETASASSALLRSHHSRSCAHESCDQAALSSPVAPRVDHPRVSRMQSAAIFALRFTELDLRLQWTQDEAPPPGISAHHPLSINLRI